MRTPYFEVTAQCKHDRCETGTFVVERKNVIRKSTDEKKYVTGQVVCPGCRMWADVVRIKEVK